MTEEKISYRIGLDIGVASVGWVAIRFDDNGSPCEILALGSRIFEKAEVPKTRESLATGRRLARGLRRRLERKRFKICVLKEEIERYIPNINWKELFTAKEDIYEIRANSALNYGYAIIRGAVARSVITHGLTPFLGLFHHNQYNGFNLADDLLEPFRPVCDIWVYENIWKTGQKFNTEQKRQLLTLLSVNVIIGQNKFALATGIDVFVTKFIECIKDKKDGLLCPEVTKLGEHNYE